MSLREAIVQDVQNILGNTSEFALPVELIDPDGVEYTGLSGLVTYESIEESEVGTPIVVRKPMVSISRNALTRIPLATDCSWSIRIPDTPSLTANKSVYLIEKPVEGGESFGYITLALIKMSSL